MPASRPARVNRSKNSCLLHTGQQPICGFMLHGLLWWATCPTWNLQSGQGNILLWLVRPEPHAPPLGPLGCLGWWWVGSISLQNKSGCLQMLGDRSKRKEPGVGGRGKTQRKKERKKKEKERQPLNYTCYRLSNHRTSFWSDFGRRDGSRSSGH